MPPRSGKSQLGCVYFPAWYLGNFPDRRVIVATYGAELARDWGRQARNLTEEVGEDLFGVEVDPNSSAADRWGLRKREGGMVSAGVGGPITGRGADVAVVDDPYKNWEEAHSEAVRERVWDWFTSTLYTRLEEAGAIVLLMARWHEFDLAGRLKREGTGWEVVTFPAIAEEEDALGRKPGEPLWPEKFSLEALELIRRDIGSAKWSALYQQKPVALEGAVFQQQWFRYFYTSGENFVLLKQKKEEVVKREDCWRFQTVDLAASKKQTADYFVLMAWAMTPDRDLLLLDVERVRVEAPEQIAMLKRSHRRWQPGVIYVGQSGMELVAVQNLVREGLPVRGVSVDTDKVSRALVAAVRYENEQVFHRKDAPWLVPLEEELMHFPRGRNDDQVDAVSLACSAILAPQAQARLEVMFW